MHYEILDQKRIDILPILKNLKDTFYLAGGTGLALLIGHRDSIDFDFFTANPIDTQRFYLDLLDLFRNHKIVKIQEEKNTLTVIVDDHIKISFFTFPYPVLEDFVEDEDLKIASILDIACMKLSAIVGRSVLKDYIDIYFILKTCKLSNILNKLTKKMPDLDHNLVLKSLVYFEDITNEQIIFKNDNYISLQEIKVFFEAEVKKLV